MAEVKTFQKHKGQECSKCGHTEASIKYSKKGRVWEMCGERYEAEAEGFVACCGRCGYEWFEEIAE